MTQVRYAAGPGGQALWVPVTDDERLHVINSLPAPSGWREIIRQREDGKSLEEIHRHVRCSMEELKRGMEVCYNWIETELHNRAMARAGGPALHQAHVDADVLRIMEAAERELQERYEGAH